MGGIEAKRADVQLLAMRQTAAEHVLRDSWRDRVPTLGLNFQEQLQQPSTGFALSHSWAAVLQLSVPIYDGGLRSGEKRERRALVDEAAANLTGGKVQARSDVRIAGDAIRLADQGLASARRAGAQAHEALATRPGPTRPDPTRPTRPTRPGWRGGRSTIRLKRPMGALSGLPRDCELEDFEAKA